MERDTKMGCRKTGQRLPGKEAMTIVDYEKD
jgi:hypothetical protein